LPFSNSPFSKHFPNFCLFPLIFLPFPPFICLCWLAHLKCRYSMSMTWKWEFHMPYCDNANCWPLLSVN
jgi:hypothetical protein